MVDVVVVLVVDTGNVNVVVGGRVVVVDDVLVVALVLVVVDVVVVEIVVEMVVDVGVIVGTVADVVVVWDSKVVV